MEALTIAYESLAVGVEIALQKFVMRDLPPLDLAGGPAEGLVCIVTGPTSGIGKETAKELAKRGAHVVLACRSIQRGQALMQEIEDEESAAGNPAPSVEVMELDLSSLASIRRFAATWSAINRPVHVLVNNAGIFSMSAPRAETEDGFESHMGTNHLGHFLLTMLLLPHLKTGAADINRPARVVNVTSRLHLMGRIRQDDPNVTTGYHSLAAYAQSKLAQVMFSSELTHRSGGDIIAVAVHPGEVLTEVVRSLPGPIQKLYNLVMSTVLLTPAEGARSSVYCATSPDLDTTKFQGEYYYDSNCAPGHTLAVTRDPEANAWLWKWSAKAVKLPAKNDLPPPTQQANKKSK